MDDFEWGWVIGILEGEAAFVCSDYKHRRVRNGKESFFDDYSAILKVSSTDIVTLERLRNFTEIGVIKTRKTYSELSKKPQFEWRVDRRNDLREFLPIIRHHLSDRRKKQIDKMLEKLVRVD